LPTIAIIALLGVFAGLSVAVWKIVEISSLHVALKVAISVALWAPVFGIALKLIGVDEPDALLVSFIPALFLGMGVAVWKLVESPLQIVAKVVIAVFAVGCPGLAIAISFFRGELGWYWETSTTLLAVSFVPAVMTGLGVAIWKLIESSLQMPLKVVIAVCGVGIPGLGIIALLVGIASDREYFVAFLVSFIPGIFLAIGVGAWKLVESESLPIAAKVSIGVFAIVLPLLSVAVYINRRVRYL